MDFGQSERSPVGGNGWSFLSYCAIGPRSGHAPGDGSRARALMSLGVSRLEEGIGCRHILG
jgi:hypothetical protein